MEHRGFQDPGAMRPEAGSSGCWSWGSNHYPSSHFPKASIGITVEKCPKLWSGVKNKDRIAMPACKRRPLPQENVIKENKGPGVVETSKSNAELASKDQKASEKLSTRLIPHETPTMQAGHVFAEHTSVIDTEEGMLKNATFVASKAAQAGKSEKAAAWVFTKSLHHETPTAQKVQFFANQASALESQDGVRKKTASIAFEKRLEKGTNAERAEEVAFTAMQEMHMLHKGIDSERPEQMTKFNNEALRMKLWEILGMTSQRKQNMNSSNPEDKEEPNRNQYDMASQTNHIMNLPNPEDKEASSRNQRGELPKENSARSKQNSDTIETDSESPNEIIRRPVPHSLMQKKAPSTRVQRLHKGTRYGKMALSSSSSESKQKLEEKNIFTFDEEDAKAVSSGRYVGVHSNRSNGKRSEQKKKSTELRKVQLPTKLVSGQNLKSNERDQTVSSPDKVTPRSKKTASSPCLPFQHDKDILQVSNKVPDVNHHVQSEANKHLVTPPLASSAETQEHSDSMKRKRCSWEHMKGQVPNAVYPQKGVDRLSVEKTSTPLVDFQSPTFAMDASPPPRNKLLDEDLCTPVATQRRISSSTSSWSKILENHKPETDTSNSDTQSADETREIHESENVMFPHDAEGKDTEKQPFLTPIKNKDYKSFEASDSFEKGYRSSEEWFLHAHSLHKRVHCPKDKKISKSSLSLPSHIGTSSTEEPTVTHGVLEQYPEDSLARAVCQLALVLERFKTKIRSKTCKKRSEILSAAGKNVCLQLQHAESQIEADLAKFLGIGKSKGKHLELRFQEQQGRLRFMYDKFKEEIYQHLLGCRNTLEEIEASQIELKASLDRQKASHRKLILQVEEAIESQLSDAETRVAALHKEANKKMNGLKHVLKDWMLEGTVN